ncbi:MAG: hypothetical protein JNK65_05795 [Deltaproteobacteria bacterium]|nr:hypothetical protein [Deltaproteobacteria bacterium]
MNDPDFDLFLEKEIKEHPEESEFPESFWTQQRKAILNEVQSVRKNRFKIFLESLLSPRWALVACSFLLIFWGIHQYSKYKNFSDFSWEEAFLESEDDESNLEDLDESELENYYASVLLNNSEEDLEEDFNSKDLIENLNEEETDQLIQHFEQNQKRSVL